MEFENIADFDPRECISGKMNRINRITSAVFRKYISPFGITNSQLTLLFILAKRNDLNQKQLSEIAVLEKSSLNRNLKRLIEQGYVSKASFPIIQITTEGKQKVNLIIPEWRKAMSEIEQILSDDGQEALNLIISKLLK